MEKCSISVVSIQKEDKLSLMQFLKNELECKQMEKKNHFYMHFWKIDVCSDVCQAKHQFWCWNVGQISSNPGSDHWKAIKKVLRYLQGTNDHMLT